MFSVGDCHARKLARNTRLRLVAFALRARLRTTCGITGFTRHCEESAGRRGNPLHEKANATTHFLQRNYMITLAQIQNKLIEAITTSSISKAEISRRVNISSPTLSQYLSGRAMPALDTFANLCKVLDVSADDILCIDD